MGSKNVGDMPKAFFRLTIDEEFATRSEDMTLLGPKDGCAFK